MYVLTVEVDVDPDHRDDYMATITQQARTSVEQEEGCIRFDVVVSNDDPNRFLLYEIYKDRAAFDLHVEQPHSKVNGAKTKPWIRNQVIRIWSKSA